jgi:hypothetical protein
MLPQHAGSKVGERWMRSQVVLIFDRPNEVRCYETEQAVRMLRTIAVPFICWQQRCIRGSAQRKIIAYQEPTVSRPFLLFQRVVAVDKLLARDRVLANISRPPEMLSNTRSTSLPISV